MAHRSPERPGAPRGRVNLVVALSAEAQPLIDHFRLAQAVRSGSFRRFANQEHGLALAISGVGRVNAAAAVACLAADSGNEAWLNVGIAGHGELPLGEARMAHKIHCTSSGRNWYPPLVFDPPCTTASVRTVDRAARDFPTDDLYDMEAAGFYQIAARFAPHELIHSLKVVSDNSSRPADALTRDAVGALVGNHLETIDSLISSLRSLSTELRERAVEPEALARLLEDTHFTTTQRRQLRALLRRWATVCGQTDAGDWVASRGLADAHGVIGALADHLEDVAPRFTIDR